MMIKVEKITKIYGKRHIFSDFSYTFPDKGFVCLVGSSGSGKSTLLNMISGVDNNYSGIIEIDGVNLKKLSNSESLDYRLSNIGYVFQSFNLLNLDTVFNNVMLPLETAYVAKPFILKKRVHDAIKLVDLTKLEKQRINKLSGGEKQRVAIARALINDPKVILCDEPTGALDEKNSESIFNLLKEISSRTLVIVATHDLDGVKHIADQILEIKDGEVKIKTFKRKKQKEPTSQFIGKGKSRLKPRVPFMFKVRYAFQKIKAKKIRSIIMNLMLSLALTGIGLSLIITNSVSRKVEDAFKAILNGNQLVISSKNETENTFSTTYSTPLKKTMEIYGKYQYLLEGIGVNYMVNFEDFFKDDNEFFVSSKNKLIPLESLSARNINDFKWIDPYETKIYYPFDYELLDDDQVILGLSYEDMVNLCFKLQIQRSYSSLGHYIYENGLNLALNVRNDYWQYDDEQLLAIQAICEVSKTCIYHTNQLWNEIVFEEMMRIPSDDDEIHEFPWEMYKIYYLKTKGDPSVFLNATLYDEYLYDFVFERTNSLYNPAICKPGRVCNENRLYVYSVDKKGMTGAVLDSFLKKNSDFKNYYFTSDYGYASYSSNLFSGFSRNIFVSLDEDLIDQATDADVQLKEKSGVAINVPDGVIQGNFLLSMGSGLRFSTNMDALYLGRKPVNNNEIVISKGLALSLDKNGDCLGKYMEISGEIEEHYISESEIEKTYNRSKALVVGIVDESKNYIYHDQNWTISFFRDKLGVSSFYLIPKSIVLEFKSQDEAKSAMKLLEDTIVGYKITNPIDELKTNIDTTLDYANTMLKVFSILAAVISILLLGTTMMLNIIESENDIKLLGFLGIKRSNINSCFVTQSVIQGMISFLVSSAELIIIDFLMGYMLSDTLGIQFKFSLNGKPILIIFMIALLVPMIVSRILLFLLNLKHLKISIKSK